jgi:hypothetical protein
MSRCNTYLGSGKPCQFPARNGSAHCINHDPEYADTQRENVRSGGAASGEARKPIPFSEIHVDFSTRAGIQAAAEAIAMLEFVGRISPTRSRNIIRVLSLAARNFDREGPIDHGSHYHQPEKLAHARHELNKNLAAISEEAALRDAAPADAPAAKPKAPQPKAAVPDPAKAAARERLWAQVDHQLREGGFSA